MSSALWEQQYDAICNEYLHGYINELQFTQRMKALGLNFDEIDDHRAAVDEERKRL